MANESLSVSDYTKLPSNNAASPNHLLPAVVILTTAFLALIAWTYYREWKLHRTFNQHRKVGEGINANASRTGVPRKNLVLADKLAASAATGKPHSTQTAGRF